MFPIYQAANDLDLPICIHITPGCPLFLIFSVERNHTFGLAGCSAVGFRDIIANKIQAVSPAQVRFIEASAGWVPFLLHIQTALQGEMAVSSDPDMFREYRIFVACEADEDVNYARFTGEDHLIIGSDYGHQDPSEERQLGGDAGAKTFPLSR